MGPLNITFNPYIKAGEYTKELNIHGISTIARVRFTAETTIAQVQEILEAANICPKAQQRLIMSGKQCDGNETLENLFYNACNPGICLIMRLKSSLQPLKQ